MHLQFLLENSETLDDEIANFNFFIDFPNFGHRQGPRGGGGGPGGCVCVRVLFVVCGAACVAVLC